MPPTIPASSRKRCGASWACTCGENTAARQTSNSFRMSILPCVVQDAPAIREGPRRFAGGDRGSPMPRRIALNLPMISWSNRVEVAFVHVIGVYLHGRALTRRPCSGERRMNAPETEAGRRAAFRGRAPRSCRPVRARMRAPCHGRPAAFTASSRRPARAVIGSLPGLGPGGRFQPRPFPSSIHGTRSPRPQRQRRRAGDSTGSATSRRFMLRRCRTGDHRRDARPIRSQLRENDQR